MTPTHWNITLKILRQKEGQAPHYDTFTLLVSPDEYVLDAVERVWAFHDRSLTYRHACHHSTCGACGMRVNGVEKLTCITPIREVTRDGGTLVVEPLRNFPVLSDLVVDVSGLFQKVEKTDVPQVVPVDKAGLPSEKQQRMDDGEHERLIDCIECGLCVSACPIALTTSSYFGPAAIAAAQLAYRQSGELGLLNLVDCQDGVWRCHSAFECTAVCPSNVDPAWRIMAMRRQILTGQLKALFFRPSKQNDK